jgi:Fe2+ transport system protein B
LNAGEFWVNMNSLNMTFNFDAGTDALPRAPRQPATAAGVEPSAGEVSGPEGRPRRRALLVGQPNVGKSVVFGALTGTYVTVSNYPGTTVEVTRGRARFGSHAWEVVDTPGTHNLVPMSEDEAVTRDILVSEPHDALVQIGDAKNLARTLLLTLQLAELGIPFCLDLNMLDEARARGVRIDLEALGRELRGIRVNASTATEGEGLDGVRQYLAESDAGGESRAQRRPLPCAPHFPDDVEQAIAAVEESLTVAEPDGSRTLEESGPEHKRGSRTLEESGPERERGSPVAGPSVARRAIATMLLAGERGVAGALVARIDDRTKRLAKDRADALARAHGVPVFALLSRLRLARAQALVRAVQTRDAAAGTRAHAGSVPWVHATMLSAGVAAVSALAYDGALALTARPAAADPLADYGFFDVTGRLFSTALVARWSAPGLLLLAVGCVLGTVLVRRHARARAGGWKLATSFAAGWTGYWAASLLEGLLRHTYTSLPVHVGAVSGLVALAAFTRAGDRRDASLSARLGSAATHPVWGLPILALVLLLAYKVVGVFGAGTAVDFVENRVFGGTVAQARLDAPQPDDALTANDVADDGAERLVVVRTSAEGTGSTATAPLARAAGVRVVAQKKTGGVYVLDPAARIDVYGGEARVWTGYLNRWAFGFFSWVGIPLLTAFFVGPYGLLTMGVTYAVAIVLPVVTTFFFVFSMLEDSGYLPRLAVMSNRVLRSMGLNGKAVLPMVLGLGCDTMATLTARIMETRKERMLVTLLLALGIPCSSQLSVIFALMQRTSGAATLVWLAVVVATLFGVGWVAAKVLPGDKSDFLLEMPPIRQPMLGNIVAKTMARIEWYLKEAVPLFLVGTALLFVLDALHLLVFVHKAGEPVVHHVLGFPREGAVSDRVSEALLVGFLRRDFGAAGLLDMARAGKMSAADVAVSMVTITLFIPCIANVFMIGKERGWRVAARMSAFIFPYAVAVGAIVRLGFRAFGGQG